MFSLFIELSILARIIIAIVPIALIFRKIWRSVCILSIPIILQLSALLLLFNFAQNYFTKSLLQKHFICFLRSLAATANIRCRSFRHVNLKINLYQYNNLSYVHKFGIRINHNHQRFDGYVCVFRIVF